MLPIGSTVTGATLVAAIELVSPGNKDRPEARLAFAAKCVSYLTRGVGLIVVVGALRGLLVFPTASWQFLRGFVRGRRAEWLPAVEWEKILARPLDEVRRELNIDAPPTYAVFRSTELPATGLL